MLPNKKAKEDAYRGYIEERSRNQRDDKSFRAEHKKSITEKETPFIARNKWDNRGGF